jgi:tripartite motif-containing protein 71
MEFFRGYNLYVCDTINSRVVEFNPSGGTVTIVTSAALVAFNDPEGVALDSSNNIYIADSYGNRVVKFNSSWGVVAVFNYVSGSPNFGLPTSVAVDSSSNIYVSNGESNADGPVFELNPSGKEINSLDSALGVGFRGPDGGAVDSSKNLYIADTGNNRIVKYTP